MDKEDILAKIEKRREKLAEKKKEMEQTLRKFLDKPEAPIEMHFGPEFKRQYRAMLEERAESEKKKKAQQCVTIKLQETETINLLDIPFKAVAKDGPGASQAQWYNECYLKWQKEKEDKCMRSKFVQTENNACLSKNIQTEEVVTQGMPISCSVWDNYDSHQSVNHKEKPTYSESDSSNSLDEWPPRRKKYLSMAGLRQAVTATERVLSSNLFKEQQMEYSKNDKAKMGVKYKAEILWSCVCPEAEKAGSVNDICWNHDNPGLVGVGYGRFAQGEGGLVCCWSIKSPLSPERVFRTDSAPTSISFARTRPNLLAVATYKGAILLLDITSRNGNVVVLNRDSIYPLSEPLWCVQWYTHSDGVEDWENIMSVGQAGDVDSWNIVDRRRSKRLIQLKFTTYPVQKTSGHNDRRVRITLQRLSGLSCSVHPTVPNKYYVATSHGCIIVCETQNDLRYKDIFCGHAGPVYGVRHSPFWDKVFATYGADTYLRIWVEGIDKPLVQLKPSERAVESADWSPSHPSVMATSSGDVFATWDLGRRSATPLTKLTPPKHETRFTTVRFSPKGNNVLAGCSDGSIIFYNLTEMPYPPYLQKEALKRALDKVLEGKSTLIRKLDAIYHS